VVTVTLEGEQTGNVPFHTDYRKRRFAASQLPYDITNIREA
jgi:hypothetical protein